MSLRAGLVLLAGLAIMPVGVSARKKPPLPPKTTIVCTREVKSATGYVSVMRTLDTDKRLIGITASWVYRLSPRYGDTAFQAGWYAANGAELDFGNGWLGVDFDTNSADAVRALRGRTYAVELATSNRAQQGGYHLRGRFDRFRMFAISYPDVTLDWGDVAAMARGADRLFLVARDKQGKLLRSTEIDRTIFAKAIADVAALAEQVRTDAADPDKNCQRETETNDIII